jgi:NAD(P)-dependent dehydrogenase (short-subunit alcohol dehydrogenase family)
LLGTRAIKSSILKRNSFRIGEVFALLYPTTRSIVGTSPLKGRLMTDHGRKAVHMRAAKQRSALRRSGTLPWQDYRSLRLGFDPEAIGPVIAFLASDDARWITGDTVRADGRSKL